MKKILIIALALVLTLSMTCVAMAESHSYAMTSITDADGNDLCAVNEDGTVTDADGNDVSDQYPILVFVYDDETMTGTWGDEAGNTTDCTLAETDEEDGTAVMTATFEDGSTIDLVYSADDDAFIYTSEEQGYMCVLTNVDGLADDTTEEAADDIAEDTAA